MLVASSIPLPFNTIISPTLNSVPAVGDSIEACGGIPIATLINALSTKPRLSVTVNSTVFNPNVEYDSVGSANVDVRPSPNFQKYVSARFSESVLLLPYSEITSFGA